MNNTFCDILQITVMTGIGGINQILHNLGLRKLILISAWNISHLFWDKKKFLTTETSIMGIEKRFCLTETVTSSILFETIISIRINMSDFAV